MKLASIQIIKSIEKHPNADSLDIAQILGYKVIVKIGQFKVGDTVVFIEPDSQLPDKPWAAFYKSKSSRVRAIKLRGSWSMGIIESFDNIGLPKISPFGLPWEEGSDITEFLEITKYEPPAPQDLNAAGPFGFGIPKTDEDRYQSLREIPYGELCDVTLKVDGQSSSFLYKDGETGIGGRTMMYKLECDNNFTRNNKKHRVLEKLSAYCQENKVNLCIRGEQYGQGIQKFEINPHAKLPVDLAFYSTWLIDERCYANKGHPLYIFELAKRLELPTVPIVEKDVIITPELIAKYDEGISTINGKPFEGVVIQWKGGSFKIINKAYDSKK